MSSIITINSDDGGLGLNAETLKKKIEEELYHTTVVAERVLEEITRIRGVTHPKSGVLSKALAAAEISTKEVQKILPETKSSNSN